MNKKELRILSEKIQQLKNVVVTEEGTKASFILPFLQILGYDVFNPLEVGAECVSDIGSKKGEKVDYVIFKDSLPLIAIECKKWTENLDNHQNQLIRYFHTTKSRIALLTNGILYRFFSDFKNPNILDDEPFFSFNMLDFTEDDMDFLSLFSKEFFSMEKIKDIIEEKNLEFSIKNRLTQTLLAPDEELIKYFIKKVTTDRITKKLYDSFEPIIKNFLISLLDFKVKDIEYSKKSEEVTKRVIETTEEELDVFRYIKELFPKFSNDFTYKDYLNHFSILFNGKLFIKVKILKTKSILSFDKTVITFDSSFQSILESKEQLEIKLMELIKEYE